MTLLTKGKFSADKFSIRGQNTSTLSEDQVITSYEDICGVHVVPETESFSIEVITSDFAVEMDFPGAEEVREALEQFEARRILEVEGEPLASVRIIPSSQPLEGPRQTVNHPAS